jgi:hypothetical protein
MDCGYYNAAVIGAYLRSGARFSVTARLAPAVKAAIAAIPGDAWTAIRCPRAGSDDQLGCWASDAEIAEVGYTAFTSKKGQAVTARLVVRRVRDQSHRAHHQGELFPAGATTRCSPTPRSSLSRPRNSTATTPSSSSCWRT